RTDLRLFAYRDSAMTVHLAEAVDGSAVADFHPALNPRPNVDRILKQAVAADRDSGGVDDAIVGPEHAARAGTAPKVAELEGGKGNADQTDEFERIVFQADERFTCFAAQVHGGIRFRSVAT